MSERDDFGALYQMRSFLDQNDHHPSGRLPPERSLCVKLGITRTVLRKALATLELEGRIWRHVGRGTFVGKRPREFGTDIPYITKRTNPAEVMEARLLIEPELARLAALNATSADIGEMEHCIRMTRAAPDWRAYEAWDNKLHRAIAQATQNSLLLSLFDSLNTVRRAVVWGRLRVAKLSPDLDHHSFAEHDAILEAIVERDMTLAAKRQRQHLETVRRKLLHPFADRE